MKAPFGRAEVERLARSNRWLALVVVVLLAGFAVDGWLRMAGEPETTWSEAPAEVRGVWTTDDSRYDGRSIRVGAQTVEFGLGLDGDVVGRLDRARELNQEGLRIIRLEFRTDEGADELDIVPAESGVMYLRTQPGIRWTRGRDSG